MEDQEFEERQSPQQTRPNISGLKTNFSQVKSYATKNSVSTVAGVLIVLAIALGVWYMWQKYAGAGNPQVSTEKTQEVAQNSPIPYSTSSPKATLPSPAPNSVAQLPQTGSPIILYSLLPLGLLGGGLILRRYTK